MSFNLQMSANNFIKVAHNNIKDILYIIYIYIYLYIMWEDANEERYLIHNMSCHAPNLRIMTEMSFYKLIIFIIISQKTCNCEILDKY